MRVLYIGGTGEISFECVHESVRLGHDVTVFNRGNDNAGLPSACRRIAGDMQDDAAYARLAREHFDVVCQFRLYDPPLLERDLALFTGHCGQYVFISSASVYAKPFPTLPITEDSPLGNAYWRYARDKQAMEDRLRAQTALPYTIVRPSHTYRRKMPSALGGEPSRLLRGKPVIVHGDGESLWTVTHASDFARPFARLLGNEGARMRTFHITSDGHWTWNEIFRAMAAALAVEAPELVHVASDTIVRYVPEWRGRLLGDKAPSVWFDNARVKSVVGDFTCPIDPWRGMHLVAERFPPRAEVYDAELDALYDRIIADHRRCRA